MIPIWVSVFTIGSMVLGIIRPTAQIYKIWKYGTFKERANKPVKKSNLFTRLFLSGLTDLSFAFFAGLVIQLSGLLANQIYFGNTLMTIHFSIQIAAYTIMSVIIWKKGGRL